MVLKSAGIKELYDIVQFNVIKRTVNALSLSFISCIMFFNCFDETKLANTLAMIKFLLAMLRIS